MPSRNTPLDFARAYSSEDYRLAVAIGRGLLPVHRHSAAFLGSFAYSLHRTGSSTAAVDYFQKSLELEDAPWRRVLLAEVLISTGEPESACVQLRHALRSEPENTEAMSLLGSVLIDLRAYEDAASVFHELFRSGQYKEDDLANYAGIVLTGRYNPSPGEAARFRSLLLTLSDCVESPWLLAYVAVAYKEVGSASNYRKFAQKTVAAAAGDEAEIFIRIFSDVEIV